MFTYLYHLGIALIFYTILVVLIVGWILVLGDRAEKRKREEALNEQNRKRASSSEDD